MDRIAKDRTSDRSKTSDKTSPVRAVLSWLVESEREFRVAQSMVNETHDKI